jgi:hypothetical protein
MLYGLIVLILLLAIGQRVGLVTGFLVKDTMICTQSQRLGWACLCGFFPASVWLRNGDYLVLLLGAAIALAVYTCPQYYRIRRAAR